MSTIPVHTKIDYTQNPICESVYTAAHTNYSDQIGAIDNLVEKTGAAKCRLDFLNGELIDGSSDLSKEELQEIAKQISAFHKRLSHTVDTTKVLKMTLEEALNYIKAPLERIKKADLNILDPKTVPNYELVQGYFETLNQDIKEVSSLERHLVGYLTIFTPSLDIFLSKVNPAPGFLSRFFYGTKEENKTQDADAEEASAADETVLNIDKMEEDDNSLQEEMAAFLTFTPLDTPNLDDTQEQTCESVYNTAHKKFTESKDILDSAVEVLGATKSRAELLYYEKIPGINARDAGILQDKIEKLKQMQTRLIETMETIKALKEELKISIERIEKNSAQENENYIKTLKKDLAKVGSLEKHLTFNLKNLNITLTNISEKLNPPTPPQSHGWLNWMFNPEKKNEAKQEETDYTFDTTMVLIPTDTKTATSEEERKTVVADQNT
jgi:hypothetical protein